MMLMMMDQNYQIKWLQLVCFLGILACPEARHALSSQFPCKDIHMSHTGSDPGTPLFLTPYIQKGDIQTAQKLSRVGSLGVQVESYSGFLTVNPKCNGNLFFWLFPAESQQKDAPLLLWLQGGPGGSSLFGLFVENGPFGVDKNNQLFRRKFSWNENFNVVYIDNPVQTGFSFSDKCGLSTTEADVAENLYSALSQLFQLFPHFQQVDFYITGESYAGKYLPALGHKIHTSPKGPIKLKGVAIGDGFTDPEVMLQAYGAFLFQIGLFDENQAAYFDSETQRAAKFIQQGNFKEAYTIFDVLLNADISTSPSYFTNATGFTFYFNYLLTKSPEGFDYYESYLALPEVRRAIHVGNLTYNSGRDVEEALLNDVMQSAKPWLAELMDNYKVMLYNGQLDIIVAPPLTEAMLQTTQWSGLADYKNAERYIWKVSANDAEAAGYVRRVRDFYQVIVRNGGHILPYDQPERAFDLINRFVSGTL